LKKACEARDGEAYESVRNRLVSLPRWKPFFLLLDKKRKQVRAPIGEPINLSWRLHLNRFLFHYETRRKSTCLSRRNGLEYWSWALVLVRSHRGIFIQIK
jgi:hypothetical protein